MIREIAITAFVFVAGLTLGWVFKGLWGNKVEAVTLDVTKAAEAVKKDVGA